MPSAFYHRPLENPGKIQSAWYIWTTTRKILTFVMCFSVLVVYFVWNSLATSTSYKNSYTGKSKSQTVVHSLSQTATVAFYGTEQEQMASGASWAEGINAFMTSVRLQQRLHLYDYTPRSIPPTTSISYEQPLKAYSPDIEEETLIVCNEWYNDARLYIRDKPQKDYNELPLIYFVTPTYPRREQIPELTRLAHTLLHVPRIHWILANDCASCNMYMDHLLIKFGIPFTHISSPMPNQYRKLKPMPRGVANRRAAIHWLRKRNITHGVLYFGDDDNTYDLKLFSEIRTTRRVSMFPVGLIGDYSISGPVVRKEKVIGFLDSWVASRHWPVDMAGFAVNLALLAEHPTANMPYKAGYEEDLFLRSISLKLDDIEAKGDNCTEILVWHTQTKNKIIKTVQISPEYLDDRSNLGELFKGLQLMGLAITSESEGEKAIISKNGKPKPLSYFLS